MSEQSDTNTKQTTTPSSPMNHEDGMSGTLTFMTQSVDSWSCSLSPGAETLSPCRRSNLGGTDYVSPYAKNLASGILSSQAREQSPGFPDLPYELRLMIYTYLIGPASERHFPCSDAFYWSLLASGFCTGLLACNKQINAEAKGIFYRKKLLVVPFSYITGRMIAANFGTSQISSSSRFSREPYLRLSSALLQRLRLSSRLHHSHDVGTVAASGHRESALKFLANSTAQRYPRTAWISSNDWNIWSLVRCVSTSWSFQR